MLLNLTYSSKIISISSALKLVVKFSGEDFKTTGGCVSISPPVGLPLFAQLRINTISNNENLSLIIFDSYLQRNV